MPEVRFHDQLITAADIDDIGSLSPSPVALLVVAPNSVNDLPSVPLSDVVFYVNGELSMEGISNFGLAVNVDPIALGFNIGLNDKITAIYVS